MISLVPSSSLQGMKICTRLKYQHFLNYKGIVS